MSIVQAYLEDLRNERDSWFQARREICDMLEKASEANATKVVQCLDSAYGFAFRREQLADTTLKDAQRFLVKES